MVFDYIVPQFDITNVSVAINMFTPGQYLPLHGDLYGKYKTFHNLKNENIRRFVLMLEDSVPGQISQICDETIGTWKAGDWFGWDNDDIHAVYNFSTVWRYGIQITGVPTKNQMDLNLG